MPLRVPWPCSSAKPTAVCAPSWPQTAARSNSPSARPGFVLLKPRPVANACPRSCLRKANNRRHHDDIGKAKKKQETITLPLKPNSPADPQEGTGGGLLMAAQTALARG